MSGGTRDQDPGVVGAVEGPAELEGRHLRARRQAAAHRPPRPRRRVQGRARVRRRPAAHHDRPKSFTIDAADNIYVLDVFSARVLVLDADGQFQKALPFPADAGFVTDLAVDCTGRRARARFDQAQALLARARTRLRSTPLGGDLTESLVTTADLHHAPAGAPSSSSRAAAAASSPSDGTARSCRGS